MLAATTQHLTNGVSFRVPSCLSVNRIVRVPTKRNDSTAQILVDYLRPHAIKRHTIEIFAIFQLNLTQVKAHNSGIAAYKLFDIAALLRSEEHTSELQSRQ